MFNMNGQTNDTAVSMPSVTLAMKAKNIFLQLGYNCKIKRLSGSPQRGCTHFITVNADPQTVTSVLLRNNIRYGEFLTGVVGT